MKNEKLRQVIEQGVLRGAYGDAGRARLVEFYIAHKSAQERTEFVKNQYGTGGFTVIMPDKKHKFMSFDCNGAWVGLWGNQENGIMKWSDVANLIDDLIKTGKFLHGLDENIIAKVKRQEGIQTTFI